MSKEQTLRELHMLRKALLKVENLNKEISRKTAAFQKERTDKINEGISSKLDEREKKKVESKYHTIYNVIAAVIGVLLLGGFVYLSYELLSDGGLRFWEESYNGFWDYFNVIIEIILYSVFIGVPFLGLCCALAMKEVEETVESIFVGLISCGTLWFYCKFFASISFEEYKTLLLYIVYSVIGVIVLRLLLIPYTSSINKMVARKLKSLEEEHEVLSEARRVNNFKKYAAVFKQKEQEIKELKLLRDAALNTIDNATVLADKDKNIYTVDFLIDVLEGKRADTLKEALNLFDASERERARIENEAWLNAWKEQQALEEQWQRDREQFWHNQAMLDAEKERAEQAKRAADELERIRKDIEEQ